LSQIFPSFKANSWIILRKGSEILANSSASTVDLSNLGQAPHPPPATMSDLTKRLGRLKRRVPYILQESIRFAQTIFSNWHSIDLPAELFLIDQVKEKAGKGGRASNGTIN